MRLFTWTALAALFLSGAAAAQTPQGRSGMSTGDTLSNMNAYRELRAFGICFVRTQRTAALAIISADQGSREEDRAMNRYVFGEHDSSCMGNGDRSVLSTIFVRGTIAEGLLLSGGVPPNLLLPAPAPQDVRDLAGAGRCYAAGHDSEIRAVLATQPGSPQETAAVGAIWNDFRPCLARFRIRLNAIWIRYILAEGLLRLAPAAPAVPSN
jgi:hypothetical protein